MNAEPIDPRDTQWEEPCPTYRVYFWARPTASAQPTDEMWHSDEWRITQATDIHEVLEWATRRATPDRRFALYAEVHDAHRPGLLVLAGTDPTETRARYASDLPD